MTKQLEALIAEMKAAAENATQGEWCTDSTYGVIADAGLNGNYYVASCSGPESRPNTRFIAKANPANVLALIAALEQSQRANTAQDDHINQQQDRIEQLEKGHQEAAKHITSWHRLAKQNIAEREKDIAELGAARNRIAELESTLELEREKTRRVMSRNHQLEASPLAVRLPQRLSPEGYHIDEAYLVPDPEGDYLDRDEVIDAIRAAGGTVEGE